MDPQVTNEEKSETASECFSELAAKVEENLCSICLKGTSNEGRHRSVFLRCGHLFGRRCIFRSVLWSGKCPKCNRRTKIADVDSNSVLVKSDPGEEFITAASRVNELEERLEILLHRNKKLRSDVGLNMLAISEKDCIIQQQKEKVISDPCDEFKAAAEKATESRKEELEILIHQNKVTSEEIQRHIEEMRKIEDEVQQLLQKLGAAIKKNEQRKGSQQNKFWKLLKRSFEMDDNEFLKLHLLHKC